ncbi:hypothetical protein BGZ94_005442 [Podila epigama]|nr:hypothetical protein BGZ94_005442 [Podila epigama]
MGSASAGINTEDAPSLTTSSHQSLEGATETVLSGLSSLTLSPRRNQLSSLNHGPSPGRLGFAGKTFIRALSFAGDSHCQDPRPFPYLPSCITDSHLSALSPYLGHLSILNLAHCIALTDVSVIDVIVSSSPYLKRIDLTECRLITNLTVQVIAQFCSQLEDISLQGCGRVTDDAIEELLHLCTHLQKVNIGQCHRAGDRALLAILNRSELRPARISHIGIAGCRSVTMEGLMAIGQHFSDGDHLDEETEDDNDRPEGANDDNRPCQRIFEGSSLRSLEFTCPVPASMTESTSTQIGQAGTGGTPPTLSTSLLQPKTPSTPVGRLFQSLPRSLEAISIHEAYQLRPNDILFLVQRFGPSLTQLCLDNSNAVTSKTFTHILAACPRLKILRIPRATLLDDAALVQLGTARCAATLEELDLSACRNLTDACLTRLALLSRDIEAVSSLSSYVAMSTLSDVKGKGKEEGTSQPKEKEVAPCLFPSLRRLDLSYNSKVTLNGIIPLVLSLKNLCALDLSFCGEGITSPWSSSLEVLCDSLRSMTISQTEGSLREGCSYETVSNRVPEASLPSSPTQTTATTPPYAEAIPWRRGLGRYVGPMLNRPTTATQNNNTVPQHPLQYPGQGSTPSDTPAVSLPLSNSRRYSDSDSLVHTVDDTAPNSRAGAFGVRRYSETASSSSSYSSSSSSSPSSPSSSSSSSPSSSSSRLLSNVPIHLAARTDLLERTPRSVGVPTVFLLDAWFTPLHQLQLQNLFQMQLQHQRELHMQMVANLQQGAFQQQQQQQQEQQALDLVTTLLPHEVMVHPVMTATRLGAATVGGTDTVDLINEHGGGGGGSGQLDQDEDFVDSSATRTDTNQSRVNGNIRSARGTNPNRSNSLVGGKNLAITGHCEISGWGLALLRDEWAHVDVV